LTSTPSRSTRNARGRSAGRSSPGKRPTKKRGFFRRFWWVFILVIPMVGLTVLGGMLFYVYANLTVPDLPPLAQTTQILDRNGDLLTTFHTAVDRKVVPLDRISKSLQTAVIDTEDKNYYSEGAISPLGIVRALWTDIRSGAVVEGGSTITQQYVKNVFTGDERTLTRKIKEAMLAIKLEKQYSKDEILTKYLNTIYFGHGAYGIEAAAQTYFGIHASEIKPVQAALLAALIASPSGLDPFTPGNKSAARDRRNYVLDRMVEEGDLEADTAARLKAMPVKLRKETTASYSGEFFAWYVRSLLARQYGEEAVTGGGLRVKTTIDPAWQAAADTAVRDHLPDPKDPEAALVAIDPSNGEILAMVGGKAYTKPGQFNLATQASRQAGSAFKTFTLAAALKQGISLSSYWPGPSTITIPAADCGGIPWTLSNADPGESGYFSLSSATAHSVNTVYAQVETYGDAGMNPSKVAAMAHRLGITSPLGDPPPCSLTLGSQGVTPLEMTSAYATIANQGTYESPTAVTIVRNPDGEKMKFPATREKVAAVDSNIANTVTYALEGVVQYGTGTAAGISGLPVAGKTGTSQDYKNAWFCGFTPPPVESSDYRQVAVCVWVGYKKHERPMYDVGGVSGPIYGGTIPAAIWNDFVSAIMGSIDTAGVDFLAPDLSQFTGGPGQPLPSPKPSKSPPASPGASLSPGPKPTPSSSP